jgi:hypothetical protein
MTVHLSAQAKKLAQRGVNAACGPAEAGQRRY